MAKAAQSFRVKYMNIKENQVHIYFFSNREKIPKSRIEFSEMSDSDAEKYEIGIFDMNQNTHYKKLSCMKPGKKIENCTSLLR